MKIIPFFLSFCLAWQACAPKERRFTDSRALMGTQVSMTVYCPDGQRAAEAMESAFERISRLEALLSGYNPTSDISRLNKSGTGPVRVAPETMAVLSKALELGQRSNGAFDVTVGPVLASWKKAQKDGALPSKKAMDAALRLVGYGNIRLLPQSSEAGLAKAGVQVDVGGIAKGFIVGEAVQALRRHGVHRGLIVAGGDMYALGSNPERGRWLIGIRNPLKPDENIRHVEVADRAIATSGHYMRFYTVRGKRYSHIVDPKTGFPVTNNVVSATVIGPDGTTADALATAITVLGPVRGMALVQSVPDNEALVMTWDGSRLEHFHSPGFARYLR